MEVNRNASLHMLERTRILGVAAIGGFIATLAIAGLILVSETMLAFPRGLFYAVVGNALGASGTDAMNLGFYLHLLAGTSIGIISAAPIAAVRRIYISMGDIGKRLSYGTMMGFIVWIAFFVPISYAIVAPTMEHFGDGFLDVTGKLIKTDEISSKFSIIVIGALGFHIQYGLIYAIITGSFVARQLKMQAK